MSHKRFWLGLCLLLPACALARRDHRPVWNAVEDHLVPQTQPAFALALPLTVPLGLLAIGADTFVVHPLRTAAAAADDALDLWRSLDWEQEYYTEAGFTPLRTVATPGWFLLAWVGRCLFDTGPDHEDPPANAVGTAAKVAAAHAWLQQLQQGDVAACPANWPQSPLAELQAAVTAVQIQAPARSRLALYTAAAAEAGLGAQVDWLLALQDASAVVRHAVLGCLPKQVVVPAELQARLQADPDELVRERARW
jgi:hypothetical protein